MAFGAPQFWKNNLGFFRLNKKNNQKSLIVDMLAQYPEGVFKYSYGSNMKILFALIFLIIALLILLLNFILQSIKNMGFYNSFTSRKWYTLCLL